MEKSSLFLKLKESFLLFLKLDETFFIIF